MFNESFKLQPAVANLDVRAGINAVAEQIDFPALDDRFAWGDGTHALLGHAQAGPEDTKLKSRLSVIHCLAVCRRVLTTCSFSRSSPVQELRRRAMIRLHRHGRAALQALAGGSHAGPVKGRAGIGPACIMQRRLYSAGIFVKRGSGARLFDIQSVPG
jgi:hypothetical protein